jgi:hypothetical protein
MRMAGISAAWHTWSFGKLLTTMIRKSEMPGPARQFEPQITRSGGTPSKYRFTARCSGCPKADSYEANRFVDDNFVKSYFKERGWLLGRDRSYDLCPACLARPRDNGGRRVTEPPHQGFAPTTRQPDRIRRKLFVSEFQLRWPWSQQRRHGCSRAGSLIDP